MFSCTCGEPISGLWPPPQLLLRKDNKRFVDLKAKTKIYFIYVKKSVFRTGIG